MLHQEGCLSGCRVGRDGLTITLLQFVGDSHVMLLNSEEEVCNLRGIILVFESISGLKINLHKRKLMVVVKVPNLKRSANVLGCAVATTSGTYLGLPMGKRLRSKYIWDLVVERVAQGWPLGKGATCKKKKG